MQVVHINPNEVAQIGGAQGLSLLIQHVESLEHQVAFATTVVFFLCLAMLGFMVDQWLGEWKRKAKWDALLASYQTDANLPDGIDPATLAGMAVIDGQEGDRIAYLEQLGHASRGDD